MELTVGSHGWSHVDWRSVPDGDALDLEIVRARDVIAEALQRPVDSVAIPFGSYDRRVWNAVSKAFSIVCTSDGGLAPLSGKVVPRETYTTDWPEDAVASLATSPSMTRSLKKALGRAYKRRRSSP
jgi:peptidoglycan/xylan/chitin deacetylase (PgdA/CDA1 family)